MQKNIPELAGWLSLPVAALRMKKTRQRAYQMAEDGTLKSVRQIPGAGPRPAAYVVRETEIENLVARERAAKTCPLCANARGQGTEVEFCPHADVPEVPAEDEAVPV
jgi:hypothetical protein